MNTINLTELLSHNAVKGTAVLLVSLFLGLALRRMAASRRYALWITSIAVLAAMPIAMWILPAWRVLPQTVTEQEWKVPQPDWAPANEAVTANSESDQGIPTVAIQTSPSSR
jgi:ABC-type nickel/cobalt efflux system permease component RcnA